MPNSREWDVAVRVFESVIHDLEQGKEGTRSFYLNSKHYAIIIEKDRAFLQILDE